jgi:pimeloyl-ACP methyl ester carboxylesterase
LADQELGLLLLHALPLDGSMWASQMDLLPGAVWAPTLYGLGDSIEAWAAAVLQQVPCERLIVAGCSVGGSCALEVAALAPERVAALVLIGAKAGHRPEPALRDTALALLQGEGVEAAWARYWAPLFS